MLNKTMEILRQELTSSEEETERHWNWLKTYLKNGAGMSHVAAGEALAAAVVSVALLTQDKGMCHDMLKNPRDGQVGKEDFRYAFAHHTLLRLLDSYDKDEMVASLETVEQYQGAKLLALLIQELAYDGGQLAEDIGFSS